MLLYRLSYDGSFIENGRKKSVPLSSGRPGSRVVGPAKSFTLTTENSDVFLREQWDVGSPRVL